MDERALSLRERRTVETSQRLKGEARRLTAERGMSGFTIEELCSEVGVSRRTFFNYFASKENAVLGIPMHTDLLELDEPFLAAGPSSSASQLVDDVAELLVSRWERMELSAAEALEISRAFDREPQLLGHLLEIAAQGERHDIALVEQREGVEPGDRRVSTIVQILGALLRPSTVEFFASHDEEFRAIYLRRIAVLREIFAD